MTLNTVTQQRRQKEMDEVVMRCLDRGYPQPQFIITTWGYKRAQCPVCLADMNPTAYLRHWVHRHLVGAQDASQAIPEPTKPARIPGASIATPKDAWRDRAKLNHARIIASYGQKG